MARLVVLESMWNPKGKLLNEEPSVLPYLKAIRQSLAWEGIRINLVYRRFYSNYDLGLLLQETRRHRKPQVCYISSHGERRKLMGLGDKVIRLENLIEYCRPSPTTGYIFGACDFVTEKTARLNANDNTYVACGGGLPIGTLQRTPNGNPAVPDPVLLIDPRPASAGPLVATNRTTPADGFFTAANYKGAFAPGNDWTRGWSAIDRVGYLQNCVNGTGAVPDEVTGGERVFEEMRGERLRQRRRPPRRLVSAQILRGDESSTGLHRGRQ
jgi:hypothetical protein